MDAVQKSSERQGLNTLIFDYVDIFCCHIYQEKRKQRENLGWVHLRNKKGQKTHEQEVNSMKDDWDIMQHKAGIEEITKMCEEWELRLEN